MCISNVRNQKHILDATKLFTLIVIQMREDLIHGYTIKVEDIEIADLAKDLISIR